MTSSLNNPNDEALPPSSGCEESTPEQTLNELNALLERPDDPIPEETKEAIKLLDLPCTCNTNGHVCDDICDGSDCGCEACRNAYDPDQRPGHGKTKYKVKYCSRCKRMLEHHPECVLLGGTRDFNPPASASK